MRNHELGEGNDIPAGTVIGDPSTAWDRQAPGGTVTLEVDGTNGELIVALDQPQRHRHELRGHADAVGHLAHVRGDRRRASTPATASRTATCSRSTRRTTRRCSRSPYKKLGRFLHEAGAVDPATGVVYLTEDEGPDGFYRFIPEQPGNLRKGVLQMLRVKGQPKYNTIVGQTVGEVLECNWVTIDDPDPANAERNASAVFQQGRAKGGAKFLGGEGCTYRDGSVVFGSSDGGDAGLGQIWSYTPTAERRRARTSEGELELLFESQAKGQLDGPDNMTTSPGGAIVIAEDGNLKSNFVKALLPNGTMIDVAENLVAVQQHYLEASGKLYDPTVPDDGALGRRRRRASRSSPGRASAPTASGCS